MTVSFIGGGKWRKPPICQKSLTNFSVMVRVMIFKATFNNISVLSWRSVLLVEESGENHQSVRNHWQSLVLWLGLWCLIPFSTIFQIYRGGEFYWLGIRRKPPTCTSHIHTLIHNVVSSKPTCIYKTTYNGGMYTAIVDRYGTNSTYLSELEICVIRFNGPIKKWTIFIEKGLICGSYAHFCILI